MCVLCGYCVDLFNVLLIFVMGSFILVFILSIDVMCKVALASTTKTITRATFHPLIAMLSMNN